MKLCSDTSAESGIMLHAEGMEDSLLMINDILPDPNDIHNKKYPGFVRKALYGYTIWKIKADIQEKKKEEMTAGPFPGKISDIKMLGFDYKTNNVLCLEKLVLEDKEQSLDILEDFISWAWDPKENEQTWKPESDRKLAYFSSMCRDKSLADDDKIIAKDPKASIKMLQDRNTISRNPVALSHAPLASTAPFIQSCRAHIVKVTNFY